MREKKFGTDSKIFLTWACARICLNNSYLFELIRHFFAVNHYTLAESLEDSDIVVVNTCAYTDRTAEENTHFIRCIREKYADKDVIVFGCLMKISETIGQDDGLTLIGPKEIHKFSEMFTHSLACGDNASLPSAQPHCTPEMQGEINQAYIQIAQGCSNSCSYCNIKIAKGSVRSKPVLQICREAMSLVEDGLREITLLADDCGSYGHDIHTDIAQLAEALFAVDGMLKLKIYTIFPGLFLKYYPVLRRFFTSGRITYVCLPLQSGSGRILKLMNRDYDLRAISDVVAQIRRENPATRLFTHFIAGFPTETVDDFRCSLDLAPLFDCVLFLPYGANSRTAASGIQGRLNTTEQDLEIKLGMASEAISRGHFRGMVVR
jgi:MiaB/RimO family radical SAM methylthiotransferase